jgi:hypothetical protein
MELDPTHRQGAVSQAHDGTVIAPCADVQGGWHSVWIDDQAVVTGHLDAWRQVPEQSPPVMAYWLRHPVHGAVVTHDPTAKRQRNGLMPEAHAQQGYLAGCMTHHIDDVPRSVGVTWTWTYDEAIGRIVQHAKRVDLRALNGAHRRAEHLERLGEVVHEGVATVDQGDPHPTSARCLSNGALVGPV